MTYFPVTSSPGTHQDALTWSKASQTTSASGLNDRITTRLSGRLHFYLVLSAYHLIAQDAF